MRQAIKFAAGSCRYYMVWRVKRGRMALSESQVRETVRTEIEIVSTREGIHILACGIFDSSVRLVVAAPSSLSPQAIIRRLRAETGKCLLRNFPALRKRFGWLWEPEWYCSTIGRMSYAKIDEWLESRRLADGSGRKNRVYRGGAETNSSSRKPAGELPGDKQI